jgi:hypothetical protein
MFRRTMTKNTIMLIAVLAAVMVAGALAVTVTTGQAFAAGASGGRGGTGTSSINGGSNGHAHDPCGNAGALAHNPNCQ